MRSVPSTSVLSLLSPASLSRSLPLTGCQSFNWIRAGGEVTDIKLERGLRPDLFRRFPRVTNVTFPVVEDDIPSPPPRGRDAVNRITHRMCTRGFREILRSGKPLARFRSGQLRAVSPIRNSENASGNARRPNSSRYDSGGTTVGLRYGGVLCGTSRGPNRICT